MPLKFLTGLTSFILLLSSVTIAQNPEYIRTITSSFPSLENPQGEIGTLKGGINLDYSNSIGGIFGNPALLGVSNKARLTLGHSLFKFDQTQSSGGFVIPTKRVNLGFSHSLYTLKDIRYYDGKTWNTIDLKDQFSRLSAALPITSKVHIGLDLGLLRYLTLGQNQEGSTEPINGSSMIFSLGMTGKGNRSSWFMQKFRYGVCFKDLGPKVRFTQEISGFIHSRLQVNFTGISELYTSEKYTLHVETTLQLSKLLLPSPGLYDSTGTLVSGRNPDELSAFQAAIGSFHDAPNGFSEEIKEILPIMYTGLTFALPNSPSDFSVTMGYAYLHESANKGNRRIHYPSIRASAYGLSVYGNLGLRSNKSLGLVWETGFGLSYAYSIPVRK